SCSLIRRARHRTVVCQPAGTSAGRWRSPALEPPVMSQHIATTTEFTKGTARPRAGCGGPWVRAIGLAAAGIALVLHAPPALHAQAENGWIGKRVVQKYSKLTLKIEDQVIDTKTRIEIYRVEQVNGPWIWLSAPEISGWALADHVVPVEQAIEFFTDYIR